MKLKNRTIRLSERIDPFIQLSRAKSSDRLNILGNIILKSAESSYLFTWLKVIKL